MGPDTTTTAIGPGVGAFLAFFALAVALYLLMRNMNARMRRMAYRERDRLAAIEAELAAEQDAKDAKKSGRSGASDGPRPDGPNS